MELTVEGANLAGLVLHTLMYGIYVVLFVASVYFPLQRKDRVPNNGLQAIAIVLFLLITTHWIIQVIHVFGIFVREAPEDIELPKVALFTLITFIGDATMVYRLYVVWSRNKYVVVIPVLLSLGVLASGFIVVYDFSQPAYEKALSHDNWILYGLSLSIAINFFVMFFIAYKIVTVQHRLSREIRMPVMSIGRPLWFVLEIVLESAGIYTLFLVINISGFVAQKPYELVTIGATSPCIGIAFSFIIVRVVLSPGNLVVSGRAIIVNRRNANSNFQMPDSPHVENGLARVDSVILLENVFARQKPVDLENDFSPDKGTAL